MAWYVYIAQAMTGTYYTGITTDPDRRIRQHNEGLGAKLAIDQGIFVLKYVSASFPDQSSARIRELQVKGWKRVKKEKLISGEWT